MSYYALSKGGLIFTRSASDAERARTILTDELGIDAENRLSPDDTIVEVFGSNYFSYKEEDFEELATLAKDKSYICFIGEDDAVWTLKFEGGQATDYSGEILWDHSEAAQALEAACVSEFIGQIIDTFEDFLDEKGVEIDNPEKLDEDDPNLAIIYGSDYDHLKDGIAKILDGWRLITP